MTPRWYQHWWWVVLAAWGVVACMAPLLGDAINQISLPRMFAEPGAGLWLGADELGRAILPRVLAGAAISAPLAALVVTATLIFGASFGAVIGWCGGTLELLAIRVMELFQAFPGLLLVLRLRAYLAQALATWRSRSVWLAGWVLRGWPARRLPVLNIASMCWPRVRLARRVGAFCSSMCCR